MGTILVSSYILLGALLLAVSAVLSYVLRSALRAALEHESNRARMLARPGSSAVSSSNRVKIVD